MKFDEKKCSAALLSAVKHETVQQSTLLPVLEIYQARKFLTWEAKLQHEHPESNKVPAPHCCRAEEAPAQLKKYWQPDDVSGMSPDLPEQNATASAIAKHV